MSRTRALAGLTALVWGAVFSGAAAGAVVTQYSFENNLNDTAAAGVNADTLSPWSGSPSYEPGIVGQAVRIDTAAGQAWRLRATDSNDLDLASNWTLEAFVNPDVNNTGEWDRFWCKWGDGGNYWHWAFRYANNGLDLYLNGSVNAVNGASGLPANSVPLNKWSHVALVGDGVTIKGYINGNEAVSAPYVAPAAGAGAMNFGNFDGSTNDNQFTGLVDEALIHNTNVDTAYLQGRAALIPPPPVAPPPTTGLVSYWTFDGNINDVAGAFAENVGTAADNLTPGDGSANFEPGQIGQALRVGVNPGDTTHLSAPVSADVQLPPVYTIEAWVKPSELADSWQRLVLNWGGAEQAYHFAIRNNSGFANAVSLFHEEVGGGQPNANGGTLLLDAWHHIAGVADGTNLIVYLNGEPVGSMPYDGTINVCATEGLGIGDSAGALSTIRYNGLLDDLAIWLVPLTEEQIRFQYQQGLLGHGALTRPGPEPIIPEPATFALAAVALSSLARYARRRRE
ncbi:MAG: hypothetical protein AMS14_10680 [Planctomycetes bacterium DG_20]|nr:MAG: hypothetical protein AMS14_10680 [Planctomycetes bacterium DG_20]